MESPTNEELLLLLTAQQLEIDKLKKRDSDYLFNEKFYHDFATMALNRLNRLDDEIEWLKAQRKALGTNFNAVETLLKKHGQPS